MATAASDEAAGAAAMAALAELREHLIKGKSVAVDGDALVLSDVSGEELRRFPKHAPTAYTSKNGAKRYDLLAVYTCYKYAALTFSDYVMKCRAEKATMVSTVDKKDLIAYLKGDIETSAQIVDGSKATPEKKREGSSASTASSSTAASGKTKAAGEDDRAAKKRKLAQDKDSHRDKENNRRETPSKPAESAGDSAIKRVLAKERVFRNRTTVLDAPSKTFEGVLKTVELVNAETKERIEKASKAALIAPVTARKEQLPLHRLMKEKIHGGWICFFFGGGGRPTSNWRLVVVGTPIIVVPAGFSDLFTMLNARDFLEDGVYVRGFQSVRFIGSWTNVHVAVPGTCPTCRRRPRAVAKRSPS